MSLAFVAPSVVVKSIVDPDYSMKTEILDPSWSVLTLKSVLSEEYSGQPRVQDQTLVYMGRVLRDDTIITELAPNGSDEISLHLVLPKDENDEKMEEKREELPSALSSSQMPLPFNPAFNPFLAQTQGWTAQMPHFYHHQWGQPPPSFPNFQPNTSTVYSRKNKPPILLSNYQPRPMSAESDYYRFYAEQKQQQPNLEPDRATEPAENDQPAVDAIAVPEQPHQPAENGGLGIPANNRQNRVGWWAALKLNVLLRLVMVFSLFGHYLGNWQWYLAATCAVLFYLHSTGFLSYVYKRCCSRGGGNNENALGNPNNNAINPPANAAPENAANNAPNADQNNDPNSAPEPVQLTFLQLLSRFVWGLLASLVPSWDVYERLREMNAN